MRMRFGLALVLMAFLAGCGTFHCAENSQNGRVNGGCGLDHTF